MRILVYGINYFPELTGIGKYSGEMADWLAKSGHEVRVVTAPPYYPAWQISRGYSSWRYQREKIATTVLSAQTNPPRMGQVEIYRCPLWVPTLPSGIKRIIHLASFAMSSLPVMLLQLFWRPQVVLVIEPPLMCAPAALLVAKLCRAKSWLHVQDFEVDAAFDLGILRAQWMRHIVSRSESWLMRRFDRVSTISPNMVRRLIQKNVAPERAVLFSNWVDIDAIFPMRTPSAMRRELGIAPETVVALYSGNMGEKQGLEIVLEAAARLVDEENVEFVLCGDGAARQRLQQKYAGLSNVRWLPLQPLDRLNDLLNMADIHLLPQRADAADLVMPSKLTGMLASGRPVVATAHADTQLAKVVSACGIVVPPDDVDAFTQALLKLSIEIDHRNALGAQARAYAGMHMSKDSVLPAFEKTLSELASAQLTTV